MSERTKGPFDLGELPSEWAVKYIADITVEHKQGFYTKEDYTNQGVKLIRVTDLQNSKIEFNNMPSLVVDEKTYNQFKVDGGDFLFARSGGIGRYGIYKSNYPKSIFASYLIRFKFDKSIVDNYYLGYFYESFLSKKQIKAITQGSSNININAENIKSLRIPLPKLKEQQKIAAILSSVDEAIEKTEQIIKQTETVKKGLMQELLTKGIGHTEFKESPVGKIPSGWKVDYLEELAKITTGNKDTKDKIEKGKYPFFVRSQIIENINSYSFDGEAILTAGDGVGVGKVFHYINGKFDYHQRVYKLSDFKEINGKFLFYYFKMNFYKQVNRFNAKTSVDSVRREMITKMIIPLPTLNEQVKIVEILDTVNNRIDKEIQEKNNLQLLKKGLMQQLLTGKVRVPIDENEEVPT